MRNETLYIVDIKVHSVGSENYRSGLTCQSLFFWLLHINARDKCANAPLVRKAQNSRSTIITAPTAIINTCHCGECFTLARSCSTTLRWDSRVCAAFYTRTATSRVVSTISRGVIKHPRSKIWGTSCYNWKWGILSQILSAEKYFSTLQRIMVMLYNVLHYQR